MQTRVKLLCDCNHGIFDQDPGPRHHHLSWFAENELSPRRLLSSWTAFQTFPCWLMLAMLPWHCKRRKGRRHDHSHAVWGLASQHLFGLEGHAQMKLGQYSYILRLLWQQGKQMVMPSSWRHELRLIIGQFQGALQSVSQHVEVSRFQDPRHIQRVPYSTPVELDGTAGCAFLPWHCPRLCHASRCCSCGKWLAWDFAGCTII